MQYIVTLTRYNQPGRVHGWSWTSPGVLSRPGTIVISVLFIQEHTQSNKLLVNRLLKPAQEKVWLSELTVVTLKQQKQNKH